MESIAAVPYEHSATMDARTGYLCDPSADSMAQASNHMLHPPTSCYVAVLIATLLQAMEHLITHDGLGEELGNNGKQRVITK